MPSNQPFGLPSRVPSNQPITFPSVQPTSQPISLPSEFPSHQPSCRPSNDPTVLPSRQPTVFPTVQPSGNPTGCPSSQPSNLPTQQPSFSPTLYPSSAPSIQPHIHPSSQPSTIPTKNPITNPSQQPSRIPTIVPSKFPSFQPISSPSIRPSSQPHHLPSVSPTILPSSRPFSSPTIQPTNQPFGNPSLGPSLIPSIQPARLPSLSPTLQPTSFPSLQPGSVPSFQPYSVPSFNPSRSPTAVPLKIPSGIPTFNPSMCPSVFPTYQPISYPTSFPSFAPIFFFSSYIVVNLSSNSFNSTYQDAFVKSIASSLGLIPSNVEYLTYFSQSRRLSDSFVIISHTKTTASLAQFPKFRDRPNDLMLNLTEELKNSVYSGQATIFFHYHLRLLGIDIPHLPNIVAVMIGNNISAPTLSPSQFIITETLSVSYKKKSPLPLIFGVAGGIFCFFLSAIMLYCLHKNSASSKPNSKSSDKLDNIEIYDLYSEKSIEPEANFSIKRSRFSKRADYFKNSKRRILELNKHKKASNSELAEAVSFDLIGHGGEESDFDFYRDSYFDNVLKEKKVVDNGSEGNSSFDITDIYPKESNFVNDFIGMPIFLNSENHSVPINSRQNSIFESKSIFDHNEYADENETKVKSLLSNRKTNSYINTFDTFASMVTNNSLDANEHNYFIDDGELDFIPGSIQKYEIQENVNGIYNFPRRNNSLRLQNKNRNIDCSSNLYDQYPDDDIFSNTPPHSVEPLERLDQQTSPHSMRFRAIKMKFETMIQKNTKTLLLSPSQAKVRRASFIEDLDSTEIFVDSPSVVEPNS
jgi:hypothetical protein